MAKVWSGDHVRTGKAHANYTFWRMASAPCANAHGGPPGRELKTCLKQTFVVNLLKNVQLATDGCVEHFASVRFVGFASHAVGNFGGFQIG